MCGFVGYIYNRETGLTDEENNRFQGRTESITHRGPDEVGYFDDEFVRFGFKRLSIIDLEGGTQPMAYDDGRYRIVFNGEIYNYLELRKELEEAGCSFETDSDTEVILANFHYKKEEAVKDLRGMFAFVIWDKINKEWFAARDPFGIKPFFYSEEEDGMFFASEKKSLLLGETADPVDLEALQHYLTYQFVPEPLTLSKKIKRLEPGHYMTKKVNGSVESGPYWEPVFHPSSEPIEDKISDIRRVLKDSVKVHMRSDVPVGAFLSSGIDSTSIVALAKEIHPGLKTFSVGFERDGYNEADIAAQSAEKLGVENHRKVITAEEFVQELPKIIWHMDDPVADPAAVPLYFVAREASKHVKVVLSGEGADELFGGYNIYREPLALKWFSMIPNGGKAALKKVAEKLPEDLKGRSYLIRGCTPIEERYVGNAKMYSEEEKRLLLRHYDDGIHYTQVTNPLYQNIRHYNDMIKMQYVDMHTWLRGDILVKADRMTMAHSLELRVPFLDKEVFKVASRLGVLDKTAEGTTKYAFRKAMEGIVPDSILFRKKLGFPVPIRHWLKDELYDWARNLIRQSETGIYFNKDEVLKRLEWHRQGKGDHSRKIWTVLVFMIWHQIFVEYAYPFQELKDKEMSHTS
ncbi:MAG TPA: asparagine synthase (glutamine-hydrolyzing) [Bacillales bacterium]|nr:asparagine synthase (glutamine-hydrolyzing) [Bacillales bacterium]